MLEFMVEFISLILIATILIISFSINYIVPFFAIILFIVSLIITIVKRKNKKVFTIFLILMILSGVTALVTIGINIISLIIALLQLI